MPEEVPVIARWREAEVKVRRGEHHLPTGPKSSVAYGIKSDHKQETKQKKNRREGCWVQIKKSGMLFIIHAAFTVQKMHQHEDRDDTLAALCGPIKCHLKQQRRSFFFFFCMTLKTRS